MAGRIARFAAAPEKDTPEKDATLKPPTLTKADNIALKIETR